MSNKETQSYLDKCSKVSSNTQEFAKIEYNLQLCLGSSAIRIKNIWSVASGHNNYNFEKNNKGLLTLDSWIETKSLDGDNKVEKVIQKGFNFNNNTLIFPTGQIRPIDGMFTKNRIYELMMLKVAVGKSYCIPQKNYNPTKPIKIPYGFNSIYLYSENFDNDINQTFRHDYIIQDNSQVLPLYVVQFEFDIEKEDQGMPQLCEICQETKASVYCKQDEMSLCLDCDQEHHAKGGRLVSKHQRMSISEKPKNFGFCGQHLENKLELFCVICRIPLCVYCKISGSHKSGEPSNHTVVRITEAYNKVIAESRELDPLIEKRKGQLQEQLYEIDTKIKEINQNASFVEEKIYKILQDALLQLQEETQKKMTFLIGDQLEVKRQIEQISWFESFLRYQQDVLQPQEYLNNWSKHQLIKNELLNLSNIPVLTNVEANIYLEGMIQVVSSSTKVNQDQAQNQQQNTTSNSENNAGQTNVQSKFLNKIFNTYSEIKNEKNQKLFTQLLNNRFINTNNNTTTNNNNLNMSQNALNNSYIQPNQFDQTYTNNHHNESRVLTEKNQNFTSNQINSHHSSMFSPLQNEQTSKNSFNNTINQTHGGSVFQRAIKQKLLKQTSQNLNDNEQDIPGFNYRHDNNETDNNENTILYTNY